jgi:hypothetical protein
VLTSRLRKNSARLICKRTKADLIAPFIALLRKVRHRGVFKVGWVFTFAAAAYNLVRMKNLAIQAT